jgi:hypothetical protein
VDSTNLLRKAILEATLGAPAVCRSSSAGDPGDALTGHCDPCGMCRGHASPGALFAGQAGAGSFDAWADARIHAGLGGQLRLRPSRMLAVDDGVALLDQESARTCPNFCICGLADGSFV